MQELSVQARIAWAQHLLECRICGRSLRLQAPLCELGSSLRAAKRTAEQLLTDANRL